MDILSPSRRIAPSLDPDRSRLKPRPSGITLWRPTLVLPKTVAPVAHQPAIVIAEPQRRPEAVVAQVEATRSVLRTLVEARESLGERAEAAESAAGQASSEWERVAAMMETYRAEAALDEVLKATLRQVTALMEARGLR